MSQPPAAPPPLPRPAAPVLPYGLGGIQCPRCGFTGATRVSFTWWGGILGPKLLHHTKCGHCRYTFNAKTGQPNTTGIIVYTVVVTAIFGVVGFLLFAGLWW